MSRILRRPMFRGGRVDARGTGIASGLGYQSGGRVGFKTGGSYWDRIKEANSFLFHNPDAPYTADTRKTFLGMDVPGTGLAVDESGEAIEIPQRNFAEDMSWVVGPGKFMKAGGGGLNLIRQMGKYPKFPKGYKSGELDKYVDPKLLSNEWYMSKIRPYLSGAKETLAGAGSKIKEFGTTGAIGTAGGTYGLAKLYDMWKNRESLQEIKEETGDPEIDPQITALNDQISALEQLLLDQAKVKKSKTLTEDEKLAKIEKNKEMIQKAYGSGVADDASAMLLNFAGKALKPEATVKSAFGEFFEEEGKRPSERKKYKDAATTAAINAFLTGEKTMAEVEAWKEKSNWGDRNKLALAQEASAGLPIVKRIADTQGKYRSKKAAYDDIVPAYLYDNKDTLPPVKNINYEAEDDVKLVEENVGEIFIDLEKNKVFMIVVEDGVVKKKILR
jgi:hypothetical protein